MTDTQRWAIPAQMRFLTELVFARVHQRNTISLKNCANRGAAGHKGVWKRTNNIGLFGRFRKIWYHGPYFREQDGVCWTDSRRSVSVIMMEHATTVWMRYISFFSVHTSLYVQRIAALHCWGSSLPCSVCVFSCSLLSALCHCTELIFFRHFRLEFQIICIPIDTPNRPTNENKKSIPFHCSFCGFVLYELWTNINDVNDNLVTVNLFKSLFILTLSLFLMLLGRIKLWGCAAATKMIITVSFELH